MKQSHLELKVGAFVAVAMVLLVVSILFFGNKSLWDEGYQVNVRFKFTNGVMKGAPVRYSGVHIGEVKEIRILTDENLIELALQINDQVQLREDVSIYINTLGVMGEKYIEVLGGTPTAPLLDTKGATLRGKDPLAMNDLMDTAQDIAQEIGGIVKSLNAVLGSPQTQEDLKATIAQAKVATQSLNKVSQTIHDVLTRNQMTIDETFVNVRDASQGITQNMEALEALLTKIKNGEGLLGQLMTDDDLYKDMEALVADIRANPWKLLIKTKAKKDDRVAKDASEVEVDRSRSSRNEILSRF